MKENKINVELIVPSIGKKYNIFIPSNERVAEVIIILNKTKNQILVVYLNLDYIMRVKIK